MKVFFVALFLVISGHVFSQETLLLDSSLKRALFPEGYKNPNLKFQNFSLIDLEGILFTEDSLLNKVTIFNFWFEGCVPCIAEFEALNELYNQFKGDQRFQFLSITFESQENAQNIINRYHIGYPVLCTSKEQIYKLIFNLGFPTTIITSPNGEIKYVKCGGTQDSAKASEMVKTYFIREINELLKF